MGQPACELDTVGYFHLFITHTAILALTGGDLHPDRTTTFLCNAAILVTSISGRALRALWTECLFPTNAGSHMKSAFTSFEQTSSFNLVHIRHKCGGCADFTQYCKVKRPLKRSVWYIVRCWNGMGVYFSICILLHLYLSTCFSARSVVVFGSVGDLPAQLWSFIMWRLLHQNSNNGRKTESSVMSNVPPTSVWMR